MLNVTSGSPRLRVTSVLTSGALVLLALAGCDAGGSTSSPDSSVPTSTTSVSPSESASESESSSPSPSGIAATSASGSPSPSGSQPGSDAGSADADSLVQAGRTALAAVPDGTLTSIESERNGSAWEVQVVTADGTEQELELSADGTEVVTGPVTKNEDIADKSKQLDRITSAELRYEEAADKILEAVPDGRITELDLDSENGATVWEADVLASEGIKHSVQIDAASGEVLSNTTDD